MRPRRADGEPTSCTRNVTATPNADADDRDRERRPATPQPSTPCAATPSRHHDQRRSPRRPPSPPAAAAPTPEDARGRHRPARHRSGHQPQVDGRPARAIGRAHTWTRSRSFSSRAGPMPSTSPSWSTLANRPLASRHAMIAEAVTGPTPGSVSSSSGVAVLRSTGARAAAGPASPAWRGSPPTDPAAA